MACWALVSITRIAATWNCLLVCKEIWVFVEARRICGHRCLEDMRRVSLNKQISIKIFWGNNFFFWFSVLWVFSLFELFFSKFVEYFWKSFEERIIIKKNKGGFVICSVFCKWKITKFSENKNHKIQFLNFFDHQYSKLIGWIILEENTRGGLITKVSFNKSIEFCISLLERVRFFRCNCRFESV